MSSHPERCLSLMIPVSDSCLGLGEDYYYPDTCLSSGFAFAYWARLSNCQLISFLLQVGRNCEVMNLAIICC